MFILQSESEIRSLYYKLIVSALPAHSYYKICCKVCQKENLKNITNIFFILTYLKYTVNEVNDYIDINMRITWHRLDRLGTALG